MTPQAQFDRAKAAVEAYLSGTFSQPVPQTRLLEAMRYSLLAGGKRLRPVLTLCFAESLGTPPEKVLPAACAVEMVHTYSLIHDDLPCMDDDDFRRGKPTNHKIYGESTAVLAGDALQAAAFETLLSADVSPELLVRACRELAAAAGPMGMCGGQQLDLEGEAKSLSAEEIRIIHDLKTAAMFRAAVRIGVICGNGTDEQLSAADEYAKALGLAFQIRDDILDCIGDEKLFGKPIGSDAARGKNTFVSLLGMDACRERVLQETARAKAAVVRGFKDAEFFIWLADSLAERLY